MNMYNTLMATIGYKINIHMASGANYVNVEVMGDILDPASPVNNFLLQQQNQAMEVVEIKAPDGHNCILNIRHIESFTVTTPPELSNK